MSDELKDHDLLITINENVKMIIKRLDEGDHCFNEIEKRVNMLENSFIKLKTYGSIIIGLWSLICIAVGAWFKKWVE